MNRTAVKPANHHQYSGLIFPELCEFDPAEEKDSGWLISFVDILTLLITLFVLLLSFSRMSSHEVEQHASAVRVTSPPVMTPAIAPVSSAHISTPPTTVVKTDPVLSIPRNIKNMVDMVATANEVNLVIKDDVLFAEGSSDLTALGRSVLDGIALMLKHNDYPISVEGHTDNIPIHTAQFPSNWELSSFRATNVARYFIQIGVASRRLRAIGYADTRPVADNDTEAGRARNRRVSLVIHVNETSDRSPLPTLSGSSAY